MPQKHSTINTHRLFTLPPTTPTRTPISAYMAPSYANIFMANLENKLLNNSPNNLQPLIWKRYIDDTDALPHTMGIFLNKLDTLRTTLLTGGYKDKDISKQFNRVIDRTQADILRTQATRSITTPKNLAFVIAYHTDLLNISNILNTHWPKIQRQTDEQLNTRWQKKPFTAYRRGKNLKTY